MKYPPEQYHPDEVAQSDHSFPVNGTSPTTSPQPSGRPLTVQNVRASRPIEDAVARIEDDLESARQQGFWGVLRLRYEAWLEHRLLGPALKKMHARQVMLDEQRRTAEAEIRLRATVQSAERDAQRAEAEWNEANRLRLASELHSMGLINLAPPQGLPAPSPVSAHVPGEQVEALALKGFLAGVESEENWQTYKRELGSRLSPYAVEEVGQRLKDLWRIQRQQGG